MYSANDGFARLTIFHQMTIGVSKTKTTILHREWLEDAEFVVGGIFEVGEPFFVSTYLANPFKINMKCIFSKIFKTLLGGEIRLRDGRHACTRLATRLGFEKTKPENEEKGHKELCILLRCSTGNGKAEEKSPTLHLAKIYKWHIPQKSSRLSFMAENSSDVTWGQLR